MKYFHIQFSELKEMTPHELRILVEVMNRMVREESRAVEKAGGRR